MHGWIGCVSEAAVPVLVIGGGQAGLAVGWSLRRAVLAPEREFVIVDAADEPGGSWSRMWPGLRLISPARYSSLPGMAMPTWSGEGTPDVAHVADYLTQYEERFDLTVRRGTRVTRVDPDAGASVRVETTSGELRASRVISATGRWGRPFVPTWPGASGFGGRQLHAVQYHGPEEFTGQNVAVVGGRNSAAQIVSDLVPFASETRWITRRPPRFMPADVDGEVLFELAGARRRAVGQEDCGAGWGDIVMMPQVREARRRRQLVAHRGFTHFEGNDLVWRDQGMRWSADAVIWCTGFRADLHHLRGSGLAAAGRVSVGGGIATADPRFAFVGYGDWTGSFSATLVGVGQFARATTERIVQSLR